MRDYFDKIVTMDEYELSPSVHTELVATEARVTDTFTPILQVWKRNPRKYVQSPYTDLRESGSISEKTYMYFLKKHPFVNHIEFHVDNNLIKLFRKWVYDNVSHRKNRCG